MGQLDLPTNEEDSACLRWFQKLRAFKGRNRIWQNIHKVECEIDAFVLGILHEDVGYVLELLSRIERNLVKLEDVFMDPAQVEEIVNKSLHEVQLVLDIVEELLLLSGILVLVHEILQLLHKEY